ncbi:MAG: hypothetical protein EBS18_05220, partial [Actinobacteria bacterium]|nr:hypothetical protein [Actinomycetota bacterium]
MSTTSNNQFLAPNQVLKYYLGKEHGLTPDQIKQADVNKDGVVNLSDVLALQKQEKAQQNTQKQQTVRNKFVEIYNNASLSNQEK